MSPEDTRENTIIFFRTTAHPLVTVTLLTLVCLTRTFTLATHTHPLIRLRSGHLSRASLYLYLGRLWDPLSLSRVTECQRTADSAARALPPHPPLPPSLSLPPSQLHFPSALINPSLSPKARKKRSQPAARNGVSLYAAFCAATRQSVCHNIVTTFPQLIEEGHPPPLRCGKVFDRHSKAIRSHFCKITEYLGNIFKNTEIK